MCVHAADSWKFVAYQNTKKLYATLLITSTLGFSEGVRAFDNAAKIVDMPKTRGPAPSNLGVDAKVV